MKIRMTRCLHLFSAGLVLTILAVSEVASRSITDITLKKYFKEQRLAKIIRSALNKPGVIRSVETKYILQKVDNFNSEDTRQYWQRYFVNTKFWNRRYGPVFVYVGGEDELSGGYLMGGEIVELAQKYGALLFGVEHRYYGISMPEKGMKLENMKYLSSRQALKDLAHFHDYAVGAYNLTSANKWIAFGGSYPGALSAWFRSKFSSIAHGAVASSAPLVAETEFPGYNEVVAASIAATIVGGSTLCRDSVKEAFQEIDRLIDEKQFTKLQYDFSSCADISHPNDTIQFVSNLADIWTNIVQYNDETVWLDIRKVCSYMTNTYKTAYQRLIDVNRAYLQQVKLQCLDNSYSSYISGLEYDEVDPRGWANARQWYYQTCTEFGYYQTCDPDTTCVFSRRITLKSMLDVCPIVFKITPDQVNKNVALTNAYYGEKNLGVSRIVFANGSIDPWHVLSILKNQTKIDETAVFMQGAAHCANMNPTEPNDLPSLKAGRIHFNSSCMNLTINAVEHYVDSAQQEIDSLVGQWLQEPSAHNH